MKYSEFEEIVSAERMCRYMDSCQADTRRAMALYRYNIKVSQELLAVVGCFEVALRNRIDRIFTARFGPDWLRDFVLPDGCLASDPRVAKTRKIILKAYQGLVNDGTYSHPKLLSKMEFGVWKYMFSNRQFRITGRCLLNVFPNKPKSTSLLKYDNTYIFKELDHINNLRNRIAHHEPVCFGTGKRYAEIDSGYAYNRYLRMLTLFQWMGINSKSLLFGLDHVARSCNLLSTLEKSSRGACILN